MKKPIVLIAAIAAVVGLRAAVALGNETTKVGTSVSIKFIGTRDRGVLHGTVSGKVNAKEGCRKQRKVALYRKNIKGLSGHRVSADRSNNRGRYRIDTVRLHGPWFWVEAKKKIIENDGKKIVCKKATSQAAPGAGIAAGS